MELFQSRLKFTKHHKMSAPSTSGLSVELLLRVIDVKYDYFTLLYFSLLDLLNCANCKNR